MKLRLNEHECSNIIINFKFWTLTINSLSINLWQWALRSNLSINDQNVRHSCSRINMKCLNVNIRSQNWSLMSKNEHLCPTFEHFFHTWEWCETSREVILKNPVCVCVCVRACNPCNQIMVWAIRLKFEVLEELLLILFHRDGFLITVIDSVLNILSLFFNNDNWRKHDTHANFKPSNWNFDYKCRYS